MKQKLLSLALALVMCLGLTAPAWAADITVTEIVPCKYDDAWYFIEGLAKVELDGKWGFVDQTGKEVVPCKYDSADIFTEGLAAVELDGKWGYIDQTGSEVIPCRYDYALYFTEGLAAVELDGKYGFIDQSGKEVIPCRYDDALGFTDGLAPVMLDGKWGYIDKTGSEVVPCRYDHVAYFTEGLVAVELDGKQGYIDQTGKEVVPCRYDYAWPFSEGFAVVMLDGKYGYISVGGAGTPGKLAYASTQTVTVDSKAVDFEMYALKDANGNDTNYIKLRDLAYVLNGTAAQFEVGWDGAVNIEPGKPYTVTGGEMSTPYSGDRAYELSASETRVNGAAAALEAITLKDDAGNGYTYYKLRDLGQALGFNVGWSAQAGVFVETDKPYNG